MEKVKIKEITKQIRGVSYGGNDSVDFPKEGYLPIMRSNNINDGILNFDKLVYVPNRFVKNTQLLKKGDILITASTGSMKVIGKNAPILEDFNGSFGAFCKVVRPQKTVNSNYLKHFFQSNYYKRTIQSVVNGANINNIKNEHIDDLEIPLPPLATQQHIAAILDQADAIIQNNRAIVQKYDALTQSLFLDMFGDPVKNEKEWKLDKLSIVAPFKKFDGKIKKINGNYWLLNLDMIEQQTGNVIEKKYVSANEINTSTISFSENQVLYSKLRPYLNKVLIPDESGYGTSELVPMNPKGAVIDKFFLAHLLRTNNFVNYINDKVAGAKMPRVNMDTLRDFQIILPPIQLQNQFTERVAMIEAQKEQAQLELAKSEELFQSLLQRAFNGELN